VNEREEGNPVVDPGGARGGKHRRSGRVDRRHRPGPERHDHRRAEERELSVEIRSTRPGGAPVEPVGRRPAFEDVEDGEFAVRETERHQRPVELSTRAADEREPDPVLLRSGSLSDEDHPRGEPAPVDDGLRPHGRESVLDYHLGAGKFGTDVADSLRQKRPQVPIIILSATLERKFGGIADIHLLKGHSSVDDLLGALRSFEAKRRGKPVVVDARDFYYRRISEAIGDDVVMEILDRDGNWLYVNEYFANLFEKKPHYFAGKNKFEEFPEVGEDWREIIQTVADTRETYIDRGFRGLPNLPRKSKRWTWNVLVFPIKLHNDHDGVVMSARLIEKKGG
jgi:two-component system OmpR family response regulator